MKIKLFDIEIYNIEINILKKILLNEKSKNCKHIVTINPDILRLTTLDEKYEKIIKQAEYVICDGVGIKKIIEKKMKCKIHKIPGIELVENLLQEDINVFLYGSNQINLELAKKNINENYKANIVGIQNGFDFNANLVNEINALEVDLLVVCLGAPKQEEYIFENKDKLKVNLAIGAGGSIDVLSGNSKRSPNIFIKLNLEWLYRNLKEPKRIGKLIKTIIFYIKIMYFRKKK